jgi:hypothetical protein
MEEIIANASRETLMLIIELEQVKRALVKTRKEMIITKQQLETSQQKAVRTYEQIQRINTRHNLAVQILQSRI